MAVGCEGHRGVVGKGFGAAASDAACVRVAFPVVFVDSNSWPPLLNVLWGWLAEVVQTVVLTGQRTATGFFEQARHRQRKQSSTQHEGRA